MREKILDFFLNSGFSPDAAGRAALWTAIFFLFLVCVLALLAARLIAHGLQKRLLGRGWGQKLAANHVFSRLAHLLPPVIIGFFASGFPAAGAVLGRILPAWATAAVISALWAVLNAADEIYRGYEISKIRPIKGLLQVARIIVLVIGGIILIAALTGQSPLVLLGGIGALTAVFMLIFQNAILGFVAGIQLTSNDMLRIGDWIEMPKYGADGTVLEISLCTVKVQNFDRSITTIPANALTADSFKNWRGMQNSGGRRIMRSIVLDMNTISLCTPEMLERFSKIDCLKDYLAARQAEIDEHNESRKIDLSEPANGRRMTNIGVFRAYITNYLKSNPRIRQDMILMVRQLDPGERGVALQLYAFTDTVVWTEYETIQSDIFDHLLAVAPVFGLAPFQSPGGRDLARLA